MRRKCHIYATHKKTYKPWYNNVFSTFKTLSLLTLYIKAKSAARNGSYFWTNIVQKSPPSTEKSRFVDPHLKAIAFSFFCCPCGTFFGSNAFHAKPTDKKQSNADRLGQASIRAEPLWSFVLSIHLTHYNATYKPWGFVPTRRAGTLAKKQRV